MGEGYLSYSQLSPTAGTVLSVGSVTGSYFQSESPLHPAAADFLREAFDSGWANPTKTHRSSRKTGLLLNEARAIFESRLGLNPDELSFIGDIPLGVHLGVAGYLTPASELYFPTTSISLAYAEADASQNNKHEIPVNQFGRFVLPQNARRDDLLIWQAANSETGLVGQDVTQWPGNIFVDSITSHAHSNTWALEKWNAAIWDSRTWQGPIGLALFAVKDRVNWRNPMPHNDIQTTSGYFSIPLAIASAIALENHVKEYAQSEEKMASLNLKIRNFVLANFGGAQIAAQLEETQPHLLTFSIPGLDSQWLNTALDQRGLEVDTGSACMSINMQPSHVLNAMGLPTTGNVRIRLQPAHSEEDIDLLLKNLKEAIDSFVD